MKLEVEKTYVDRSGDFWKVIYDSGEAHYTFLAIGVSGRNNMSLSWYQTNGHKFRHDNDPCDLVREHREPMVAEFECEWREASHGLMYPYSEGTANYEEMKQFRGNKVRVRIEEILE